MYITGNVLNIMQISGMSKTPVPMLDYIMLGPVLALVNIGLKVIIPEYYFLIAMIVSACE